MNAAPVNWLDGHGTPKSDPLPTCFAYIKCYRVAMTPTMHNMAAPQMTVVMVPFIPPNMPAMMTAMMTAITRSTSFSAA